MDRWGLYRYVGGTFRAISSVYAIGRPRLKGTLSWFSGCRRSNEPQSGSHPMGPRPGMNPYSGSVVSRRRTA